MRRVGFSGLAVLGLMFAMGSSAFGDEIQFYLTVADDGNAGCGTNTCEPAKTVLVDVNQSGTSATVTFTAETVSSSVYTLDEALFSVSGTFTVGSYTVTGGSAAGTWTNGGASNTITAPTLTTGSIDSGGNDSVESEDMHDATSVAFNLTGGTWANADGVLASSTGCSTSDYSPCPDAAAEVRVNDTNPIGNTFSAGTCANGVTCTAVSAVPEPASVLLFGSVLLVSAFLGRKKFVG